MNIEEDKELVKRIDGIEYYRKKKGVKFDDKINLRANKEQINKLKSIADSKGLQYQTLIRDLLDKYIEDNKELLKEE